MYIVQFLDHKEGTGARWRDISATKHESRDKCKEYSRRLQASDSKDDLYSYRVVEVGSDAYYSQPTDCLEY